MEFLELVGFFGYSRKFGRLDDSITI